MSVKTELFARIKTRRKPSVLTITAEEAAELASDLSRSTVWYPAGGDMSAVELLNSMYAGDAKFCGHTIEVIK